SLDEPAATTESVMEDIIAIVHACQTADDESAVLTDVCSRLRRQLRASAVAFLCQERGACSAIAADGGRADFATAERVVAANLTIPPHRGADRVEAGAPVRCGSTTIGVLMARWPLGTPYDLSRS